MPGACRAVPGPFRPQKHQRRPERLNTFGLAFNARRRNFPAPVDFVALSVSKLQLFRQSAQRPMEPGGGQVDTAQVVV